MTIIFSRNLKVRENKRVYDSRIYLLLRRYAVES
jgi:hypothetical protein